MRAARKTNARARALALNPANQEQLRAALQDILKRAADSGPRMLRAYVALEKDSPKSTSKQLTQALRKQLPPYMIPAEWHFLDELPKTPNGKVDKKALTLLAPPPGTQSEIGSDTESATNETLATILKRILSRDSIGYEDDFFELGGDSISAIQFVSEARKQGIELRVSQIFKHRTIAALAERIALDSRHSNQGNPNERLESDNHKTFDEVETAKGEYSRSNYDTDPVARDALASIIKRILGLDSVRYGDDFFELGGDSISAIQVVSEARKQGIELRVSQIFKFRTVAALAELATTDSETRRARDPLERTGPDSEEAPSQEETINQIVPFTPIQNWFFGNEFQNPDCWNQSVLFHVAPHVGYSDIKSAFARLYEERDAFRIATTRNPTGISQRVEQFSPSSLPIECIRVSNQDIQQIDTIERETADRLHLKMDLSEGKLIKAAFFITENNSSNKLLLIAHHLCVDAISWKIIADDLNQLLGENEGRSMRAVNRSAPSFNKWSQALLRAGQTDAIRQSEAFWRGQDYENCVEIPLDMGDHSENTEASSRARERLLDRDASKAILEKAASPELSAQTFLLSALCHCLKDWLNEPKILVGLEGHGREEVDPSVAVDSVVGWLTSYFPLVVDLEYAEDVQQALNDTRSRLAKVPNNGISFGLLRYGPGNDRLSKVPEPEVTLNYLGKWLPAIDEELPLSYAANGIGAGRDPRNRRSCIFEINASIVEERIHIEWRYSRCIHREETVAKLLDSFVERLQQFARSPLQTTPTRAGQLDCYPLSDAQSSLLLHRLSNPENDQGQLLLKGELLGPLKVENFGKAWQIVTERHPALRATVDWKNRTRPSLVVHARAASATRFADLSEKPEEVQDRELKRLIVAERREGNDVEILPATSMTLVKLDEDRHVFLWNCHHLILDGWSSAIVLQDLLDVLNASGAHQFSDTSPGRIFGKYYRWINEASPSEAAGHWRQYLKGASNCLISRPLSAAATGAERKELNTILSSQQLTALEKTAGQLKVTVGSLVTACWSITIANLTGRKSICFGMSVSGREIKLAGIEAAVGNLSNVVPFTIDIEPDQPLGVWVDSVLQNQERASRHSHYSTGRIMAWAGLTTDSPLFDTTLTIANYPKIQSAGGAIQLQSFKGDTTSTVPLAASFTLGDTATLSLNYDTGRLTDERSDFIANLFFETLSQIGKQPHSSLASFLSETSTKSYQALPDIPEGEPRPTPSEVRQLRKSPRTNAASRETEKRLLAILKDTLAIDSCSPQDSFFDLGGTSLQAARLFGEIERAFGKKLPLSSLFKNPSAASLAALINGTDSKDPALRSLVEIRGGSGLPPLFFIHATGVGVLFYRDLANEIDPRIPVFGFEPIGADGSEKPSSSIPEMAERYLRELKLARPKGPYVLLGHCFGATIALEMAKQLQAEKSEVPLVIAIDGEAPRVIGVDPLKPFSRISQLKSSKEAFRFFEHQIRKPFAALKSRWILRHGDPDQKFARLNRIVRDKLGRAFDTYRSEPYTGEVVGFRSKDSLTHHLYPNHRNTETHWRQIAPNVELITIDCYHHEIMKEPHTEQVANFITRKLSAIDPYSFVFDLNAGHGVNEFGNRQSGGEDNDSYNDHTSSHDERAKNRST